MAIKDWYEKLLDKICPDRHLMEIIEEKTHEKYRSLIDRGYQWETNADKNNLKRRILFHFKDNCYVKVRKGAFIKPEKQIILDQDRFCVFIKQK